MGVFTTQWLINGRKTTVATNDQLPFTLMSRGKKGSYWPSMLEKAWAKIFANYKIMEAGFMENAFKAITQAPVEREDNGVYLRSNTTKKKKYFKQKKKNSSKKKKKKKKKK